MYRLKIIAFTVVLSCVSIAMAGAQQCDGDQLGLVPRPAHVKCGDGEFVSENPLAETRVKQDATLNESLGDEGYRLSVTPKGITIHAATKAGIFYGKQTLRQLIPVDSDTKISIPCVEIEDTPRFPWRGYMLDVSRTFLDAEYVKKLIDLMAQHKMNVFHWHLTDDQGWRLDSEVYPELTATGARLGVNADSSERTFYTKDEIREIVQYAAERNVSIIPEIDIPGHSRAATISYPEILCEGGDSSKSVQGISGNVWCAGREENFEMLDVIIGEVAELFPYEYIHIGGDEVNKNSWKQCPRCQALMKEKGFSSLGNVQNYFIKRMETIVRGHGKRMMGWNEIMHGGALEKDTAVMAWIGTGPGYSAAKKGHPVVMAPGGHTYFDMKESGRDTFGHWWAGVVPMSKVYAFDPMARDDLDVAAQSNILGVHGCLWTSQFKPDRTAEESCDYKTWPRLCALSEVGWTGQKNRDFDEFRVRLGKHLPRLLDQGVGLRIPEASAKIENGALVIVPPYSGADVRYTLDGVDPAADGLRWEESPIPMKPGYRIATRVFSPGGIFSHVAHGAGRVVDRKGGLTPVATATSTMPVYGKNVPENVVDWKAKTVFWSSRKGKKGDTFTITFEEAQRLDGIELLTGKLGSSNEDNIVDGSLQISTDGTKFRNVAQFTFGLARAELKNEMIKALRVVLNADHDSWIVVQDPVLKVDE